MNVLSLSLLQSHKIWKKFMLNTWLCPQWKNCLETIRMQLQGTKENEGGHKYRVRRVTQTPIVDNIISEIKIMLRKIKENPLKY